MKKSKGVIALSTIVSIICLLCFIPTAFFLTLLLLQHGKLYYVILFSLIALVFFIGFLAFAFIARIAKNNNKSLDYLEKNGIKVDNINVNKSLDPEKFQQDQKEQNVQELDIHEQVDQEPAVQEEIIEETKEDNIILEESKEIEEDINQDISEVKHETKYIVIDNKEDAFKNYLDNNESIDKDVEAYFSERVEKNQKKREQSIKNEAALNHIFRELNYSDCSMNAKFLKHDELTLNMDYIEEVEIQDNVLKFMIFDIKYNLIFNDNNEVKAFLSYLKNN